MTPQSDETMEANRAPTTFALIVGGMKCGTTSLFDLLAQHPEVCACSEKEPDFFVDDIDVAREWDRYLGLWDWDPERHTVALEASTAYAKYPWVKGVPERIATSPGASFKFIYMMRDPVKRIASQVRHGVYDGWGKSLDEEFTDDLIDFSRYAMQADRYTALFPRENLLLLTLEELKSAPDDVLRRTCLFLGISPDHAFVDADVPRNTGDFYTVSPLVAGLAKNSVARWLVGNLLPRNAKHHLRQWVGRSGDRGEESLGRWQLNEEEVARVYELLAQDMTRLERHYGVRAPWIRTTGAPTADGP